MLVKIADTFVVSFSNEANVSGVSLVNSFNTILIFLFTALSSGGADIISQYYHIVIHHYFLFYKSKSESK